MKHKIKHIHFLGIGGVGMSGIAEVLFNLGYTVSGSDSNSSVNTERLVSLGVNVFIGHSANNIGDADVVVITTAIDGTNPELMVAKERGLAIVPRAVMLAELMRFKYGIAIAGTHGKTTTTSLCAEVLRQCGLDPTFIIGGKLAVTDSNAKLGAGDYLIAEADESDASFLYLNPLIAVVTNIDLDHMDTYDHDETKLKQTFVKFLHRLPFYGRAILCAEDERICSVLPLVQRPIVTYGFNAKEHDIYAKDIVAIANTMHFTVCIKESNTSYPITLNMPGVHNVLNALSAIAVGIECEGNIEDIVIALEKFHGVGRRMQHYPNISFPGIEAILIDDYGHHPAELKATLAALRGAYPNNRMILVFQPHRYTRTRDLFEDFVSVLLDVDQLIILEIYPAGEEPIPFIDGKALVSGIRFKGNFNAIFAKDLEEAKIFVHNMVCDGDLVVTMGAGSISKLPQMLISTQVY